jgi:hypothetical protein
MKNASLVAKSFLFQLPATLFSQKKSFVSELKSHKSNGEKALVATELIITT